jgi:hypothetical protein
MALYNSIVTSGVGYPAFPAGTPAGYQADGTELYLAFGIFYQSEYQNSSQVSMQVGKFSQTFGEALFPFGGQELGTGKTLEFYVLVSSGIWMPVDGVYIPNGAIVLGYDVDGEPLFGALAPFEGGMHPGKTKASFNGQASIGWAGKENFVTNYSILVGGV